MPEHFVEGIHPPWMRTELPEILSGIPCVGLKEKRDSSLGHYRVDGYYIVKGDNKEGFPLIRMLKEYQAKSFEEATEMAKKDGLARGLLVEQFIGEPVKCNLGEINISNLKELIKLKED